jgi:4-hydroxy-2-oxoheptanedioate aldolase
MIETRAALEALDDILGVDGIDGVFVGPSDFSIALSDGARIDQSDANMLETAGKIAGKAEALGKIPCTLAVSAEGGRKARELGFRFIALGIDFGYLSAGANALVAAAR